METSQTFSIVIVNYRSASRIGRLLPTLPETFRSSVILVNNDPGERLVLSALAADYGCRFLDAGTNRGFAAGANIGALAADGSIIGFLNPDTLWTGASHEALREIFERDREVGIVGLRLTEPSGSDEPFSFGQEPSFAELLRNNLFRLPFTITKNTSASPDWVSGGALFIRADLFRSLGGFDERFFLYFEDADLCLRARSKGALVHRAGALPITHLGGTSQESRSLQKRRFYDSQSLYFQTHRPHWEYLLLRAFRFLRYGL